MINTMAEQYPGSNHHLRTFQEASRPELLNNFSPPPQSIHKTKKEQGRYNVMNDSHDASYDREPGSTNYKAENTSVSQQESERYEFNYQKYQDKQYGFMKSKIGANDQSVNYESAADQPSSHKKQQFSSRFGNGTIPGPENVHDERQRSRSRDSSSNMKRAPADTYGTSELHARNLNQQLSPVHA